MKDLDIAEVARASGIAASALRFYEEQGLIAPIGRHGLKRLFDSSVLERLKLVQLGRAAGFSLRDIAAMFAQDGQSRIDRRKLAAKADELDRTIRKLTALRNGLRHAAACPVRDQLECPSFRRLLRAATRGTVRQPAKDLRRPASTKRP